MLLTTGRYHQLVDYIVHEIQFDVKDNDHAKRLKGGSRYSIRMRANLSGILKPEKQGGDCTSITGVSPFHSVLEKLQFNLNLLQDAYVIQP